jgi:uncharacterized membrane protein
MQITYKEVLKTKGFRLMLLGGTFSFMSIIPALFGWNKIVLVIFCLGMLIVIIGAIFHIKLLFQVLSKKRDSSFF